MVKYVIWNNLDDFNTWHSFVCSFMGYSRAKNLTTGYTCPIKHPENDTYVSIVTDNLPVDCLQSLVLLNKCEVEGFFPAAVCNL